MSGQDLINAAKKGDLEKVRSLLSSGVDVNCRDQWGRTPLHEAAKNGRKEVVEVLILNGASIEVKTEWGDTPLHNAAFKGKKEVVEVLILNGASIEVKNDLESTPLHKAAQEGEKEVVEVLILNGASTEVKNKLESTPLHLAAYHGHKEAVEVLILNGASIEVKNKDGDTPLHFAAYYGHKEAVEVLILNGASIEVKNDRGDTPLHNAAFKGEKEVVEVLILNGASTEVKTEIGNTPLHKAAEYGKKEVVEVLILNGASIEVKNNGGITAIDVAKNEEIKKLLINYLNNGGKSAPRRRSLKVGKLEQVPTQKSTLEESLKVRTPKQVPTQNKISEESLKIQEETPNEQPTVVDERIKIINPRDEDIDAETQTEIDKMFEFLNTQVHLCSRVAKNCAKQLVLTAEIASPDALLKVFERKKLDSRLDKLNISKDSKETLCDYLTELKSQKPSTTQSAPTDITLKGSDHPSADSSNSYSVNLPSIFNAKLLIFRSGGEVVTTAHSEVMNGQHVEKDLFGNEIGVQVKVKVVSTSHRLNIEREYQFLSVLHDKAPGMFVKPFALVEQQDFQVQGTPYAKSEAKIAMVLEKGFETLEEVMGQTGDNALEVFEKHQIGVRLLKIIGAAHSNNIVYMDLKPSNVMRFVSSFGDTGTWKGIDLGGSVLIRSNLATETFMGTIEYMAPELCGENRVGLTADPSMDVWALGVIVFKMFFPYQNHELLLDFWQILQIPTDHVTKLPKWSSLDELQQRITSVIETRFAGQRFSTVRHFLEAMLQVDPLRRKTVQTLGNFTFATGGSSMTTSVLFKGQQQLLAGQKFTNSQIQDIKADLTSQTALLRELLKGQNNIPGLFIMYPKPKKQMKMIQKMDPRRLLQDEMILQFLCPVTLQVPEGAPGYVVKTPKKWLLKVAPVLYVVLKIVAIALSAYGIPLPIPSLALESLDAGLAHTADQTADQTASLLEYADSLSSVVSNDGDEQQKSCFRAVKEAMDLNQKVSEIHLTEAYAAMRSLLIDLEGVKEPVPHDWRPSSDKTGLQRVICTSGPGAGVAFVSEAGKTKFLERGKDALK